MNEVGFVHVFGSFMAYEMEYRINGDQMGNW